MQLALFDLDGTLIHSEAGVVGCLRHALQQLGADMPPDDTLRSWIGPPLRQSFPSVLGDDPARIAQAVAHYHERFDRIGWTEHTTYPGIADLVEHLAAAGLRLAVVTSKQRAQAERIVAHLPYGAHFSRVYAPSGDGQHSEKASMIAQALHDFGIAAECAAMIGDRYFDIDGARANRVRALGVSWGFGSHDELAGAGADAVAATPQALLALLGVAPLARAS